MAQGGVTGHALLVSGALRNNSLLARWFVSGGMTGHVHESEETSKLGAGTGNSVSALILHSDTRRTKMCTRQRIQYTEPVSSVGWNCRSLWAKDERDTIDFAIKLARSHDLTILTETRETPERIAFLRSILPNDLMIFSSGIEGGHRHYSEEGLLGEL
jgi:hypothetical protein